jgi:hypothetical protein
LKSCRRRAEEDMGIKRGYLVRPKDDVYGIAVVATSSTEAKKIALPEFNGECDWIDLRTPVMAPYGTVSDLPIGIVHDEVLALRRGIFSVLQGGNCEGCGAVASVQVYKDKILCDDCLERAE